MEQEQNQETLNVTNTNDNINTETKTETIQSLKDDLAKANTRISLLKELLTIETEEKKKLEEQAEEFGEFMSIDEGIADLFSIENYKVIYLIKEVQECREKYGYESKFAKRLEEWAKAAKNSKDANSSLDIFNKINYELFKIDTEGVNFEHKCIEYNSDKTALLALFERTYDHVFNKDKKSLNKKIIEQQFTINSLRRNVRFLEKDKAEEDINSVDRYDNILSLIYFIYENVDIEKIKNNFHILDIFKQFKLEL